MRGLSISTAWEETKAILARDGSLLGAVALALIVLPQVVLAVAGAPVGPDSTMLSKLLYVAVVLLGFVAQIALNRMAIGSAVVVKEAIGEGFVRVLPVMAVFVIVMFALVLVTIVLAVLLGAAGLATLKTGGQPPASIVAVLVILTALIFAIFQLVFPVAAVETGNPIRLISRSWQLARGHYLRLLGFVMTVFVGLGIVIVAIQLGLGSMIVLLLGKPDPGSLSALVLGLIAGLIQGAFTLVTAVMLARIYVQLARRGEAQPSVPSSGI
jgi:hypothetical protein